MRNTHRLGTLEVIIQSILFKDFKNRPLVNNTTKDKNKELV
jgi:hypothetical protein